MCNIRRMAHDSCASNFPLCSQIFGLGHDNCRIKISSESVATIEQVSCLAPLYLLFWLTAISVDAPKKYDMKEDNRFGISMKIAISCLFDVKTSTWCY